jgi:NAD-dependent SIR2 family protein deacetylase
MSPSSMSDDLRRAADVIRAADALLITAGAGMGVDSGLPDFRGPEGFWRHYPPLAELGLRFEQMANPTWFVRDPHLAWGFYGHRWNLYRATRPHAGFAILRRWAEAKPGGYFVFTSNVDGQFQAANFAAERIVECHGSLRHRQCVSPCGDAIWESEGEVDVNAETIRARDPLPRCPRCRGLARPNVLMFGDGHWVAHRTDEQYAAMRSWLRGVGKVVVVECGAGTAVPTVRLTSQRVAAQLGTRLVRINLREADVAAREIGLAMGALEALQRIDQLLVDSSLALNRSSRLTSSPSSPPLGSP